MRIGYFLSTEEFTPAELVEQAVLAEEAGFECLWISDHFHPWNDAQGQGPFVWSLLGAISQRTTLPIATAVTCPIHRINPVIIAQAAATCAVMFDGRFTLGVGTGEALNEHVLGEVWPTVDVRLEMLEEAVGLIRELWSADDFVNHHGRYFTADTARIYTRPDTTPSIFMSGFGPESTDVAARIADGYITMSPNPDLIERFRVKSGGKMVQGGAKVSWAPTEEEGVEVAHRLWSTAGLPGELAQVLPSPRHFEQAATLVTPEQTRDAVACGPATSRHLETLTPYVEAGVDDLYVGNMGPHYTDMIRAYGAEVLPSLHRLAG